MAIEYSYKTQYGQKARILCANLQNDDSYVVAIMQNGVETPYLFRKDVIGNLTNGALILTEASPWDDVPVDTPIWVRHTVGHKWVKRHFFRYHNGRVYAWDAGKTSHTVLDKGPSYSPWNFATLENPNGN